MLEIVVGSEEHPDLVIEGEDGREGEQELQGAQEDVVRQVVVVIPVLNMSNEMSRMKNEDVKRSASLSCNKHHTDLLHMRGV